MCVSGAVRPLAGTVGGRLGGPLPAGAAPVHPTPWWGCSGPEGQREAAGASLSCPQVLSAGTPEATSSQASLCADKALLWHKVHAESTDLKVSV